MGSFEHGPVVIGFLRKQRPLEVVPGPGPGVKGVASWRCYQCAPKRSRSSSSAAWSSGAGPWVAHQPEPRGFFQFFQGVAGLGHRAFPDHRARGARASRRARCWPVVRLASATIGDAGALVVDQGDVPDLHHLIRRERRQDVVRAPHPGQGQAPPDGWNGYAPHRPPRVAVVNLAMQGQGF